MANNQYNFLDYAGLSLFWNKVKGIIEEKELATASELTNLNTRVDNVESSKADKEHKHSKSQITDFPTELPASDVYSWAKQSTKPSYSFSEITSKPTTVSGYGITDALTTSNYTTYTVKKDGTGASGTWGISITGNAGTSNRTKFLETFYQDSTTDTYGSLYPIWAQWSDSTNVRLKCTDYTVWTDKATYATSAGSVTWDNVTGKPTTFSPSTHNHSKSQITDFAHGHTGSEVTLTGYSKVSSYSEISASDTVNLAIAKLEYVLSGLEDLLASI